MNQEQAHDQPDKKASLTNPLNAIRTIADAVVRITGKHSTLKQTQETAVIKQALSLEEKRAITRRLKSAALMGTDLTTANQRLKEIAQAEAMQKSATRHLIGGADPDDLAYEAPLGDVRKVSAYAVVGGMTALVLMIFLGYQCIQALTYNDRLQTGKEALKEGKNEIAQIEFTTSLNANPSSSEAYFYRALAEMRLGNNQAALQDYGQALKLSPQDAKVYLARALLRNRMHDYEGAVRDCGLAKSIEPSLADALRVRATAYNQLGRYTEAIADSTLFLSSYHAKDKIRAIALCNRAYALDKKNLCNAAIKDYSEALTCDTKNGQIYVSRAEVYKQLHEWKQAINDCNDASKLLLAEAAIYKIRAACYAELGMSNDALHELNTLIEYYPTINAHTMRGDIRLKMNDYQGALDDFDYVLGAQPHNQSIRAMYNKAQASLHAAQKVISATPNQGQPKIEQSLNLSLPEETLVENGYNYLHKGDLDKAAVYFTQALKLKPSDIKARRYLAYTFSQSGNNSESIDQFYALGKQQALTGDDRLIFSRTLIAADRQPEAITVLNDTVNAYPRNDQARKELIRIWLQSGGKQQAARLAQEGARWSPAEKPVYDRLLMQARGAAGN